MELLAYLKILWRRKWLVILPLVMVTLVVFVLTRRMPETYTATVTMRVSTTRAGALDNVDYDILYTERLISTYVELATSRPVIDELWQTLSLDHLPGIDLEIAFGTELFYISVTDTNPILARVVANTLADILVNRNSNGDTLGGPSAAQQLEEQLQILRTEVEQTRAQYVSLLIEQPETPGVIESLQRAIDSRESIYYDLLRQYERLRVIEAVGSSAIVIVEPALTPDEPSGPNTTLFLIAGVGIGAMVGLGLAFVFEVLDTRLMTTNQIVAATELDLLGEVPQISPPQGEVMIAASYPGVDVFRRLGTSLFSPRADEEVSNQTVLVVSAEPGEGKSTIAANLAYSLAQGGRKTLLIDIDMWRPTQHKHFSLSNDKGLSDVLAGEMGWHAAVQETDLEALQVLTSGKSPSLPSVVLSEDNATILLDAWAETFEVVVLDSPALLGVADGGVLAPLVDSVAIVVRRGRTRREPVREALRQLKLTNAPLAGVVVNYADSMSERYYTYYQSKVFENGRHSGNESGANSDRVSRNRRRRTKA